MVEPIAEYHKLVFRTQKDADHAVMLLRDWATIDATSRVGPNRIVVWQETVFKPKPWAELDHSPAVMAPTVYVSPGALARLECLMPIPLPASEAVRHSDLPLKRVLMMVGDASYWGWATDSLD